MTAAERKRRQRARLGLTSGNASACAGGQRSLVPIFRVCACGCGEIFVVENGAGNVGQPKRYVSIEHRDVAQKIRKAQAPESGSDS